MSGKSLSGADKCREKARNSARRRRTESKSLMEELSNELPFSNEIVSQLDHNSRLRLTLCYMRTKSVLTPDEKKSNQIIPFNGSLHSQPSVDNFKDILFESLDGFLLLCQGDGVIMYVSESIHKFLGIFQSEVVGLSLFDFVHFEDAPNLRRSLEDSHAKLLPNHKCAKWSQFYRVKCSQKTALGINNNYKLVHMSGHFKSQEDGSILLMAFVSIVTPPSIVELDIKDNMFITHYSLDMKCIYSDGRLSNLLGYRSTDMIGHVPFEFHHHDDVNVTINCSKELMVKGEGVSGYYRIMSKSGEFVWMLSRATFVYDKHNGCPMYIVCVNYVLIDEAVQKNVSTTIKEITEPLPVDYNYLSSNT